VKCEQYWPDIGESLPCGHLDISLQSVKDFANYSLRQITLSYQVPKQLLITTFYFTNLLKSNWKRLLSFTAIERDADGATVPFHGLAGPWYPRNPRTGTLPEASSIMWPLWSRSYVSPLQVRSIDLSDTDFFLILLVHVYFCKAFD
jgi:hypothetical protein